MGSTTQHNGNGYSLAKALAAIRRREWESAQKMCDGLLNDNNRSYFGMAEVWMLLAIARVRMGKTNDAEYAYGVASTSSGMTPELDARYVRHLARFHRDQGDLGAVQHCIELLGELPGYNAGWAWMTLGRTALRHATRRRTRGGRDEDLLVAIDFFKSAEHCWQNGQDELAERQWRTANLKLWFTALITGSHGHTRPLAKELLTRIAERDPDMGRKLKRQLRLARWGYKPH